MAHLTVDRSAWSRFASAYAAALHRAGAPAPTVEEEVTRVLAARGVPATLMASPTALWVDVDGSRVVRVSPGDTDLARQVALADLGERVVHGLAPDEATDEVERVEAQAGPWTPGAGQLAFGAAAGAAAALVGGSPNDVVAAGLAGVVVSALRRRVGRSAGSALADAAAATLAGALGQVLAAGGADPARTALAAVAVLAPGMALTTAARELAAGHWSSGSARAAGALATLAQLGAGLAVAATWVPRLDAWLSPWPTPAELPLVAAAVAPVVLAILGRTRPADIPWAVLVAWASGAVARTGGPAGAFLGATLASALGAGLAGWLRVPAVVLSTPALFLLVPGALGVDALRRAVSGEPGAVSGWQVAMTVGALAAGMLLGQAAVRGAGGARP